MLPLEDTGFLLDISRILGSSESSSVSVSDEIRSSSFSTGIKSGSIERFFPCFFFGVDISPS
jgi:hypothetical protein